MKLAFIGKLLARCIPKGRREASIIALASVAETLLNWRSVVVEDLRLIKILGFKRLEAKTAAEQAEAQKKLAEAANAANKVTEVEHEKALRALDLQERAIRNRKLEADAAAAEAKADKSKADAAKAKAVAFQSLMEVYDEARQKGIAAAEQELFDALQQYAAEGGTMFVDSKNLKELMKPKDETDQPDSGPSPK